MRKCGAADEQQSVISMLPLCLCANNLFTEKWALSQFGDSKLLIEVDIQQLEVLREKFAKPVVYKVDEVWTGMEKLLSFSKLFNMHENVRVR